VGHFLGVACDGSIAGMVAVVTTITITDKDVTERANDLGQLTLTGADNTGATWAEMWGKPVVLMRVYHNGHVRFQGLPKWLAQLTVANIPDEEPHVARAWLVEGSRRYAEQRCGELLRKELQREP
jgi:hypothetical protein